MLVLRHALRIMGLRHASELGDHESEKRSIAGTYASSISGLIALLQHRNRISAFSWRNSVEPQVRSAGQYPHLSPALSLVPRKPLYESRRSSLGSVRACILPRGHGKKSTRQLSPIGLCSSSHCLTLSRHSPDCATCFHRLCGCWTLG